MKAEYFLRIKEVSQVHEDDINPQISLAAIAIEFPERFSPYSTYNLEKLNQHFEACELYGQLGLPRKSLLKAHSLVNDYMFPEGPADRLFLTGLMMASFYLFDHIYDADFQIPQGRIAIRSHLSGDLIASLEGREPRGNRQCGFLKSIREILACFSETPQDWHALFTTELKKYIRATVKGKQYAREFPQLSLWEYLHIREEDCGGWWSANLIEYVNDLYLTPEERSQIEVSKMTRLCIWICSLINDLFSFPKEMESEEHPFNAVYCCMNYNEVPEKLAVQYLVNELNQLIEEFNYLSEHTICQRSSAMQCYVQGLRNFVSGIWYWHRRSGIYAHPDSLFIELQHRYSPV
ncbi:MAG: hypothetical protein AAGE59_12360 [Cyanobacteria bacterium P01_F01_bin.86]